MAHPYHGVSGYVQARFPLLCFNEENVRDWAQVYNCSIKLVHIFGIDRGIIWHSRFLGLVSHVLPYVNYFLNFEERTGLFWSLIPRFQGKMALRPIVKEV